MRYGIVTYPILHHLTAMEDPMARKGEPASPKARAALREGARKRAEQLKNAKPGEDSQKQRFAKLLSGTITVEELTDEEVSRMRVHGKNGSFSGMPKRLPSSLISAFHAEQIKRAKADLSKDLQKAAKALGKIIEDPEAKDADIIKAANILLERGLGKTPETVHIKQVDPWADTLAAGAEIRDQRGLADLAREAGALFDDEAGRIPEDER